MIICRDGNTKNILVTSAFINFCYKFDLNSTISTNIVFRTCLPKRSIVTIVFRDEIRVKWARGKKIR